MPRNLQKVVIFFFLIMVCPSSITFGEGNHRSSGVTLLRHFSLPVVAIAEKQDEKEPNTRTTKSGSRFTRVSSNELQELRVDATKFGQAWREPDTKDGKKGLIWSDIARDEKGEFLRLNHADAEAYCRSIGAALPTGWSVNENVAHGDQNSDFVRLREHMGAELGSARGYAPQVLPNLPFSKEKDGRLAFASLFWSSSVDPDNQKNQIGFHDLSGQLVSADRSTAEHSLVRCVVSASIAANIYEIRGHEKSARTKSGAIFTRVSPSELEKIGVKNSAKFGIALRDPSGMIWGDAARDEKGAIRYMNQRDAIAFCKAFDDELHKDGKNKDLEVRLPTGWSREENDSHGKMDSDFVRLSQYLGADVTVRYSHIENGFRPQVLPSLTHERQGGSTVSRFWSSTWPVHPYYFVAGNDIYAGHISYDFWRNDDAPYVSVRCVIAPRRPSRPWSDASSR